MAKIPTTAWPKPWLLKLYERAIAEGCIRVHVGSHEQFKSLQAAFYRIRRRTDKEHDLFINESYHLCTCTWEKDRQTMLITYDKLPDDAELPRIESVADAQDMPSHTAPKVTVSPLPEAEAEPPRFDSTALVAGLLKGISFDDEGPAGELE